MRSSQPSTKAYKAKEATRELVERPPPPVVVPAAPAPAVAAPPRKEVNIPAFVQFILVGATIISAVYLAAVYNPTSFRIHPPRTSRQSYDPCLPLLLPFMDLLLLKPPISNFSFANRCDKGSWSLENLKTTPVKRYQWEASLPFAAQVRYFIRRKPDPYSLHLIYIHLLIYSSLGAKTNFASGSLL